MPLVAVPMTDPITRQVRIEEEWRDDCFAELEERAKTWKPPARKRVSGGRPPRRKAPEKCEVAGCEGIAEKRGKCNKHYRRWLVHGDVHTVLPSGVRGRAQFSNQTNGGSNCRT